MSYLLKKLSSKQEIDDVIRSTEDLVLVLRFGRDSDLTCMQLDEIVSYPLRFFRENRPWVAGVTGPSYRPC